MVSASFIGVIYALVASQATLIDQPGDSWCSQKIFRIVHKSSPRESATPIFRTLGKQPAEGRLLASTHSAAGQVSVSDSEQEPEHQRVSEKTVENSYFRCVLDSPGGDLEFWLEIEKGAEARGWLINGTERIEIPTVRHSDTELVLDIGHYDSKIEAKSVGEKYIGKWQKTTGDNKQASLGFSAEPKAALPQHIAKVDAEHPLTGRWRVQFESEDAAAVGLFEVLDNGLARGTFLTTTGDYRFLAGHYQERQLTLSCFDGGHAFLFKARLVAAQPNRLEGEFWSRDSWHESWTAEPDPTATLPDSFELTRWRGNLTLADMRFPDLDGNSRSLGEVDMLGRATLIHVFGSWCPNCHDAGEYIKELQQKYGDRGLKVIGVAFELTSDFDRNVRQVKKYLRRHDVEYPVLIAGESDKAKASEVLTIIDRVRSYPTTLFVNGQGEVVAIHTGFSGPATGEAHQQLRQRFEAILEKLLPAD